VAVKAKPPFDEWVHRFTVGFCVPSNPLPKGLDGHIRINIFKLDHCLSIVGEPLSAAVYTCGSADQFLPALTGQPPSAAADVVVPLRAMFPDQWFHFVNPTKPDDDLTFEVDIRRAQFPPRLAADLANDSSITSTALCWC
jgi:hypothetical protein